MTVTASSFRASFPEFNNESTYPDPEVDFWLGLGALLHNVQRWGNLFDFGLQLFVAHNLSLEFGAKRNANLGQNPGQIIGTVTGGTVDKVSYQRDAKSVMDPKHGHWGLSIYGIRYIRLVQMVGAGPIQIGAPSDGGTDNSAWPGPWQSIVPNPSN